MATDQQIIDALIAAAEALLGRKLTQREQKNLIDAFNDAPGTNRQKAQKALEGLTGFNESQIRIKAAASNDVDRKIDDLQGKLDDWKPGT